MVKVTEYIAFDSIETKVQSALKQAGIITPTKRLTKVDMAELIHLIKRSSLDAFLAIHEQNKQYHLVHVINLFRDKVRSDVNNVNHRDIFETLMSGNMDKLKELLEDMLLIPVQKLDLKLFLKNVKTIEDLEEVVSYNTKYPNRRLACALI